MADLTMCRGGECPLKNRCYRYTASPDEHQSYFVEIPGDYGEEIKTFPDPKHNTRRIVWQCNMYWGEKQEEIMDQLNKIVGK